MKLGKKIIALIAAFLMVFGNISFTASAGDTNPGKEFGYFASYVGGMWGHSHDGAGSYTAAAGDTFYSSQGNRTFAQLTGKTLAYVSVKCANTYVLFRMSGGKGTPVAYIDGVAGALHKADASIVTPAMLSVSASGSTVSAAKGANVTLAGDCFLGGISHIAVFYKATIAPTVSHVMVSKTVDNYTAGDKATFTFDLYAGSYTSASQLSGKTPLSTIAIDVAQAGAVSKVFPIDLPFGTYTVYERALSGYTVVGSALKTTTTGVITCAPEETVVFHNTKNSTPKSHVTVNKTLDNYAAGDKATFTFDLYAGSYSDASQLAGKTPISTIALDVNSAAAVSKVFPVDLPYGTYTVYERALSGYTVVGSALKTTTTGVAATCAPEETVYFHNKKNDTPKSHVTVNKTVDNYAAGDKATFTFDLYSGSYSDASQLTGKTVLSTITLDVASAAAVSKVFPVDLPYGTYTVYERALSGYTVVGSALKTTTTGVAATCAPEETVYFHNKKNDTPKSHVTVNKTLDNYAAGDAAVTFTFDLYSGSYSDASQLSGKTPVSTITLDVASAAAVSKVFPVDLPYGTYTVYERTLSGYTVVGSALQTVTTGAGGSSEVTASYHNTKDRPKGSVLVKKEYSTGFAIGADGVTFRLMQDGAQVQGDKTITKAMWDADHNATVGWTGLDYGTYTIIEVGADANYTVSFRDAAGNALNGGIIAVAGDHTVTCVNTRKADGSIRLIKAMADGSAPAEDMSFTLTNARTGQDVGTKTITVADWAAGTRFVEWTNLPYDAYAVAETAGDANYAASFAPTNGIAVDFQHVANTLNVTNTRKADGKLTLTKAYADNTAPTMDMTFQLTRTRDGADMGSRTLTAADWAAGKRTVEWTGLTYDKYTVAETAGDADYAASYSPSNTIDIDAQHVNGAVSVTNTRKNDGSIKVTKVFAGGYAPDHDLVFQLKTSAGAVIGTKTIAVADWVADPSGAGKNFVEWNGLTYGSYVVEEIGGNENYTTSYFPTDAIAVNSHTPAGSVTVTNTRKQGQLSIHKDVTGADPAGDTTVFHFNLKGPGFPAGGQDFTLTDNTVIAPFLVDYGTYTFTETNLDAAPGYRFVDFTGGNGSLNAAAHSYSVTVGADGAAPSVTVTANNLKLARMHIQKLDANTGNPPAGSVRFVLDRTDDSSAQTWTVDTDATTGIADVSNLEPGSYTVTEVSAPAGYDLAPAQNVTLAAGQTASITFRDTPNGWLKILKTDSDTGAGIPGVTFQLADNADMLDSATLVTGDGGIVDNTKLVAGTYWVQEISAPAGYVVDSTPRQVVIELNKVNTVSFQNTPQGWVEIYKTSTAGGPVAGVSFRLQRQHTAVLSTAWAALGGTDASYDPITLTTDANGYVKSDNIVPGTYTVTETAAPAGYLMDTTPRTVEVKRNEATRLDYTNRPEGNAEVVKLDSQTVAGIDGAKFELSADSSFNKDVSPVYEATTTGGGHALFTHLLPGTYYIRETAAAPGYRFDPTLVKSVLVELGGTASVSFDNTPEGTLNLLKRDSATGLGVDGVSFDLSFYADMHGDADHPVQHLLTANGGHIVADLEQGTYYLQETSAPAGYLVDSTVHPVVLVKGQTSSVVLDNTPEGWLEIRKTDSKTGAGIPGVTFTALRQVNPLVDLITPSTITLVTGENGLIKSDALTPGMYTVTEVSAPAGYAVDKTPRNVLVELGKTAHIDVTNTPQGFLKLKKTDSDTGLGVDGVTFQIADNAAMADSANFTAQTLTTAGGGWIASGELDAGTYYVQETAAPAGYVVDSTVRTIEIKLNETTEISLTNVPQSWIDILKTDSQTGTGIAGVTFSVQRQSNPLMNAINDLLNLNSFTLTTGEGGVIKSDAIVPGTYVVTEISAPAGYLIDATPRTVTVALNETAHLDFQNRPEGTAEIIKTDAATGGRLDGVTFQVSADSAFGANSTVYTVVTAADGSAKVEHLLPGTYYVRETAAPTGYSFDPLLVKSVTVALGVSTPVEFADDPVGWLEVRKTDSVFGTGMSGVKFGVYASLTAANADTANTGAGALQVLTTGADGSAISAPLVVTTPKTDFYVKELSGLPGYVTDHSVHTVTVEYALRVQDRQPNPVILNVTNTPLGGLQLLKVDSLDNTIRLPGAAFALYADEALTDLIGEATTDAGGVAQWTGIEPGDYWVLETAAPEGYVLNDAPIPVSVRPDANPLVLNGIWFKSITVLNEANPPEGLESGDLKIIKTDALTGKRLPGATFKIFADEARTDLVAEETTDANGEILLEGLDPATYWVVETKAPKDYVLNSTPVSVDVKPNKLNVITLVNEYHPPKGVQTGMMEYNILLGGGAVLILGMIFLMLGMRRGVKARHLRR